MNKMCIIRDKAMEHTKPSFNKCGALKVHILRTLVMQQRMLYELVFAAEKFLTNLTVVRLLLRVNQVMPVKMILISEHLAANVALVLLYQAVLRGMLNTGATVTRGLA
jgi:hypothetical protein